MRNAVTVLRCPLRLPSHQAPRRSFGSTPRCLAGSDGNKNGTPMLNPRWLSELQTRIKHCANLNLEGEQKAELEALQEAVNGQWLELLAGREGFLTSPGWRGLDRHTVTWGDQDAMVSLSSTRHGYTANTSLREQSLTAPGHVNNVVYNKYAESARVNWLRNFATTVDPEHANEWTDLMTPRGIGLIMRSIKTDYKFPMAYPDNVTVLHKLTSRPTYESDYILLEALLISHRHRRPAARCFEDIVVYDYKTAKRTALKPFMVERLRETYDAQERSKVESEEKVKGLVELVEKLEKAL